MLRSLSLYTACAAAVLCLSARTVVDPPKSIRTLAPDSTYIMVTADNWEKTVGSWKKTGVYALMQTDALKKIFGSAGAEGNIEKHLKEIGAPEGSLSWPDAFGAAFYTSHNEELDNDEPQMLFYGDWGARADATGQLVEAVIADSVKREGWKVDTGDEVLKRKLTVITLPEDKRAKEFRERFGGQVGIEMARTTEKLFYVRDGSRFFMATERAGLQDALEAVDGSRKCKVSESREYQAAMDQIGEQAVSVVMLLEPMQKASSELGMWSMAQAYIQPLIGDVQALALGANCDGKRGQIEMTGSVLLQGKRAGLWNLLGAATPVSKPPAMISADSISFSRVNMQFKEVMPILHTMASNMPPEMTDQLDGFLVSFGDIVSKAMDALGPSVYSSAQVRQPLTPESLVSTYVVDCNNPKAVVPMLAQFGPEVGIEPRDVDGNTIFGDESSPISVGVSNGYMAVGDPRQVQAAMRSIGQKDLPNLADSPAYKKAAQSVGSDAVVGWGYSDLVARWTYDREMLKLASKSPSQMGDMMDRTDDSTWAKRFGYELPPDAMKSLAELEPALLAKHVGATVWTLTTNDRGLVARYWLLPGTGE